MISKTLVFPVTVCEYLRKDRQAKPEIKGGEKRQESKGVVKVEKASLQGLFFLKGAYN